MMGHQRKVLGKAKGSFSDRPSTIENKRKGRGQGSGSQRRHRISVGGEAGPLGHPATQKPKGCRCGKATSTVFTVQPLESAVQVQRKNTGGVVLSENPALEMTALRGAQPKARERCDGCANRKCSLCSRGQGRSRTV